VSSSPTSSHPSSAEKRRSTSKSEEFLDTTEDPELFDVDDVTVRRRKNAFRRKRLNTEPGVISSESSSENSSVNSEQTNSIRARSGSELIEESDSEEGEMEKDPAEIERKTNILVGTKKFNMDPKKGIEFLVEKNVFEYTVQEVARVSA
jgi:hypothetical protein